MKYKSELPGSAEDTFDVVYETGHIVVHKHPAIHAPFFKTKEVVKFLEHLDNERKKK